MKTNERVFCFYELKIKVNTLSGNPGCNMSVADVFALLNNLPKKDFHPRRKGAVQVFGIDDFKLATGGAALLFYRSDMNEAPGSVRDHLTEVVREHERLMTEGNSYSSHVLVVFDKNPNAPAKVLVEQCRGIGPTRIETLLRQIFKKYKLIDDSVFKQKIPGDLKDENGDYILEEISFDFEITGIPSDSLITDLNNGQLTAFELVQEGGLVRQFDEEEYFVEKEAVVRLQVADKNTTGANKFQEVQRVLAKWKQDYSKARVRIKPRAAKEYTLEWDAMNGFADEYVKKVVIKGFDSPLKSTYKEIHKPILDKMVSEANRNA